MKTHHGLVVGLSMLCAMASWTWAQEEAVKVTEKDFAACQKLRYAAALKEAKRPFAREEPAKTAAKQQWEAALKEANWTEEQYEATRDAIDQTLSALSDIEKGGEDAQAGKETLESMDKTTVETVKTHRKEWTADGELTQKAQQQVRAEAEAERRGPAPDAKSLEGTWVIDLEATVDLMTQGFGEDLKKEIRAKMKETMKEASYTFGPGDQIVVTIDQGSGKRTDKGTYRLEGSKLFFKSEGSKRENSLDCGLKDGTLRLGMMGMYSVFRKG